MALYGVFGSHTTEQCPLNNEEVRKMIVEGGPKLKSLAENAGIKVISQYHSALEHTFFWALDSKDPQTIETMMINAGWAKFNTMKIVPLFTFDQVIERCRTLEKS